MAEDKKEAVAFVTKKVLVTFSRDICLLIGGTAVFAMAAICEYQADLKKNDYAPSQLTVVGLPDGRQFTKSLNLTLNYGMVAAMVELD